MPKKHLAIAAFVVLLAAFALYANWERFTRKPIQITHRLHRFGGRFDDPSGVAPLMFELDSKVKLTSIKVVLLSEVLTNKHAHPFWHLVSPSNSTPTKGFLYGMAVPGMQPAVPGATAQQLAIGPAYRLLLESGSLKAQHDFDLVSTFR